MLHIQKAKTQRQEPIRSISEVTYEGQAKDGKTRKKVKSKYYSRFAKIILDVNDYNIHSVALISATTS